MGILSSRITMNEETKTRTCDMIVWGEVSRDAELGYTRQKEIPKAEFSIRYDNHKFMSVTALGDFPQTAVASRLEKGDFVICAGQWEERQYKDRNGNDRTWSELKVGGRAYGIIAPLGEIPGAEMAEIEEANPQASALGTWQQVPDDDDLEDDLGGELPW